MNSGAPRRPLTFAAAVEALYRLKTGVIGSSEGRHERPHKPVLLLAVFDALAAGVARPDQVLWSTWLRDRFRLYFDIVKSHNDECTPENPFHFMAEMIAAPNGRHPRFDYFKLWRRHLQRGGMKGERSCTLRQRCSGWRAS